MTVSIVAAQREDECAGNPETGRANMNPIMHEVGRLSIAVSHSARAASNGASLARRVGIKYGGSVTP